MENTLENKVKFFALHWGQKIHKCFGQQNFISYVVDCRWIRDKVDYLELTPLSQITDYDASKIGFGNRASFLAINTQRYIYHACHTDYLRSKGYALPWMGLSVEQLIEYGWIKLKED